MAPQQRTESGPSRKSRRLYSQTAAGADMRRVRKRAKNKKSNDRKKRNKARGKDALRRLQAGDIMCDSCQLRAEIYRAAHPHAARSDQGAATAARLTYDAATSTDDLHPVTMDVTESECEITGINEADERHVPRFVHRGDAAATGERANLTWARFVDEIWAWLPVVSCAALFYGHWRGDFDARLVGLRG